MDISEIQSQIYAYYESKGMEASKIETYLQSLDGVSSIDAGDLDSELVEAYLQLAFLQLWAILYPDNFQSVYAQIGSEDFDFDSAYEYADEGMVEMIMQILEDNPELMALAADADGDGETSSEEVKALLAELTAGDEHWTESYEYTNDAAWETLEELGLDEDYYSILIEADEGLSSAESYIMGYLAELDMQMAEWNEMLKNGEITIDEFNYYLSKDSMERTFAFNSLKDLSSALSNIIQMFADLQKTDHDSRMAVIQNTGSA